jgi:hypothetical protein
MKLRFEIVVLLILLFLFFHVPTSSNAVQATMMSTYVNTDGKQVYVVEKNEGSCNEVTIYGDK